MNKIVLIITLLTLFFTASIQADDNLMVSSSGDVLWIIDLIEPGSAQQNSDSKEGYSFKVYARKSDGKFIRVAENLNGKPTAADAVGSTIKIYLKSPPQSIILSVDSQDLTPSDYPGELLTKDSPPIVAVCTAEKFGNDNQPAIFAAVPQPGIAATQPSAQPAQTLPKDSITALAQEFVTKKVPSGSADLRIISYQQGKWSLLTTLKNSGFVMPPQPESQGVTQKVSMLSNDGKLFVMVRGMHENLLHIFDGEKWTRETLDMPIAIGLVRTRNFTAVVASQPNGDAVNPGWTAKIYPLFTGDGGYVINSSGKDFIFKNPPTHVARVGDSVAVISASDRTSATLTICQVNGNIIKTEPISILTSTPPAYTIVDVQQYFLWGVLGVVLAGLLTGRSKPDTRPFAFPLTARPAGLLKRLLAFLIDFVPFIFVGGNLFAIFFKQVDNLPLPTSFKYDQLVEFAMQVPPAAGIFVAGSLTAWAVYCCIMEWKFGWTFGKRALKLTVITDPTRKLTFRQCLIRNAMKIAEIMLPLAWIITAVLVVINPLHLRLGDIIAKTFVCDASGPPPTANKQNEA